jgi:hypothetical protein
MSTNYSVRTFEVSEYGGSIKSKNVTPEGRAVYLRADANVTRSKASIAPTGIWFPVPPESYEFTPSGKWNTVSIVGFGDVIHPAGRGLAQVSMQGFFPSWYDKHVCVGIPDASFMLKDADAYVKVLTNLHVSQDVVLLSIDHLIVNLPVAITSFAWSEAPGRPHHRLFSITFTEWRKQKLTVKAGVRYEKLPKTYKPRSGEDLFDVSYRFFGTPSRAKEIAKMNGIKWTPKATIPDAKKVLKLTK